MELDDVVRERMRLYYEASGGAVKLMQLFVDSDAYFSQMEMMGVSRADALKARSHMGVREALFRAAHDTIPPGASQPE